MDHTRSQGHPNTAVTDFPVSHWDPQDTFSWNSIWYRHQGSFRSLCKWWHLLKSHPLLWSRRNTPWSAWVKLSSTINYQTDGFHLTVKVQKPQHLKVIEEHKRGLGKSHQLQIKFWTVLHNKTEIASWLLPTCFVGDKTASRTPLGKFYKAEWSFEYLNPWSLVALTTGWYLPSPWLSKTFLFGKC